MKRSLIKSLFLTLAIFVFSISSAFALKKVNVTYAATSYKVTFYAQGGTWADEPLIKLRIESISSDKKFWFANEDVNNITKEGYKLDGWRAGSATSSTIYRSYIQPTGNLTLYAKWVEDDTKNYTVKFDLNGASGSIPNQTVKEGGVISKPSNPTRSGYTFKYWSKTSSGSEYSFTSAVNSNLILYAIWEKNVVKYTVKFDLNGGSGNIPNQTIAEGGKVSKPSNPTRSGYTFRYWSTAISGSEYNFNSSVDKNMTLYAVWKKNETSSGSSSGSSGGTSGGNSSGGTQSGSTSQVTYYTVSFNVNGGTGSIDSQKIAKGKKATKPANPTKANATFDGWATSKSCKSSEKYNFDKSVTKNITLYACYVDSYQVTFKRTGLPFINSYTKNYKENSNLQEYNQNNTLVIVDVSSYKMLDFNNCKTYMGDIYSNLNSEELTKKCNNLNELFKCSNEDDCYGTKYIILDETSKEDVSYLKKNKVIEVETNDYEYMGLYRDSTCETKYKYSSSISKNMTLYECYQEENSENNNSNVGKKKGVSVTLILIICAVLAVIGAVIFIIRKSKIANSVN